MNNKHLLIALGLLLACNHATYAQKGKSKEAKTTFQTSEPWKPETDVRADATMVYGTLDKPGVTFEQRIQSWRDKGYLTEFMTGVAWRLQGLLSGEMGWSRRASERRTARP